ncbi:MAG: response regulator transcription factor [Anaerolineales bacterium]|nr:response regulator transcription factor [Anaerolineales bacterium]
MTKPKILLIEDEPSIISLVTAYLRQENYEVQTASDGLTGLKIARTFRPDLLVLDIMLPQMDGLEVLTHLRRESNVYVILLTARAEETDKIVGLSLGADDYVTKPFSPRELVARIKSALRRIHTESAPADPSLYFPRLRIDPASHQVWFDDQLVELTATEFQILLTLAEHPRQVLSREQLLEKVWGGNFYGEERVVDVHLGNVRRKLGGRFIATVRGVGYRFEGESA